MFCRVCALPSYLWECNNGSMTPGISIQNHVGYVLYVVSGVSYSTWYMVTFHVSTNNLPNAIMVHVNTVCHNSHINISCLCWRLKCEWCSCLLVAERLSARHLIPLHCRIAFVCMYVCMYVSCPVARLVRCSMVVTCTCTPLSTFTHASAHAYFDCERCALVQYESLLH